MVQLLIRLQTFEIQVLETSYKTNHNQSFAINRLLICSALMLVFFWSVCFFVLSSAPSLHVVSPLATQTPDWSCRILLSLFFDNPACRAAAFSQGAPALFVLPAAVPCFGFGLVFYFIFLYPALVWSFALSFWCFLVPVGANMTKKERGRQPSGKFLHCGPWSANGICGFCGQ